MSDGTMFAGDHGPEGDWKTLKGRMLEPHTAAPLESGNEGDPRFNGEVGVDGWEKSLKPVDSPTGPGGTLAK